jgi:TrmH family RNA methyltransferase
MKHLSSRHNPLVATFRSISRGRHSDPSAVLLDGAHLVAEALSSRVDVRLAVISRRLMQTEEGLGLLRSLDAHGVETFSATDNVLSAMSPVATPSGIVAIAGRPSWSLGGVLAGTPQLVVAAVDVQDPGNVGAIARAAEAGGASGVVFCGTGADPFGPKALRGSMGSLFRLPSSAGADVEETIDAAKAAGARVLAAVPRGGVPMYETDLRPPTAFLLGGEGPGLPENLVARCNGRISIPMRPTVESLNVAIAAAVLVYEAARQRTSPPSCGPSRGSS